MTGTPSAWMILLFSHPTQNNASTPNGVDDAAQPCSPFRTSRSPWLTLSEQRWVASRERLVANKDWGRVSDPALPL